MGEPSLFGRRILVLAPHPDDEVLGAGAALVRARAAGASLFVRFLTDGVVAREQAWPWDRRGHGERVARRQAEAEVVSQRLGLTNLGFPAIPTRTLRHHLHATRKLIVADVQEFGIDRIWVPAFEGAHQDHDAANALASTLRPLALSLTAQVWEFACYGNYGGQVQTQHFPVPMGGETLLTLSREERAAKSALLALYRSERENLRYAGIAQEAFRPLPDYEYSRPPHPEPLFWQRFQWVPFRHPRVDFTASAEVYPELGRFVTASAKLSVDSLDAFTE